jgi:hypothetical protein
VTERNGVNGELIVIQPEPESAMYISHLCNPDQVNVLVSTTDHSVRLTCSVANQTAIATAYIVLDGLNIGNRN